MNLLLYVEVAGCPTVCAHCWAQGVPYNAMAPGDARWVLEQAQHFCKQHGLALEAFPMHEVAAHPRGARRDAAFPRRFGPRPRLRATCHHGRADRTAAGLAGGAGGNRRGRHPHLLAGLPRLRRRPRRDRASPRRLRGNLRGRAPHSRHGLPLRRQHLCYAPAACAAARAARGARRHRARRRGLGAAGVLPERARAATSSCAPRWPRRSPTPRRSPRARSSTSRRGKRWPTTARRAGTRARWRASGTRRSGGPSGARSSWCAAPTSTCTAAGPACTAPATATCGATGPRPCWGARWRTGRAPTTSCSQAPQRPCRSLS